MCVYVSIQLYCSCCHYGVIKHDDDNPTKPEYVQQHSENCSNHFRDGTRHGRETQKRTVRVNNCTEDDQSTHAPRHHHERRTGTERHNRSDDRRTGSRPHRRQNDDSSPDSSQDSDNDDSDNQRRNRGRRNRQTRRKGNSSPDNSDSDRSWHSDDSSEDSTTGNIRRRRFRIKPQKFDGTEAWERSTKMTGQDKDRTDRPKHKVRTAGRQDDLKAPSPAGHND